MSSGDTLYHSSFETPVGPFSVAVRSDGAAVGAFFGGWAELSGRIRPVRAEPDERMTALAREQILAYLGGARRAFGLALAPRGTAFELRVWEELGRIPYGQTRSYGEVSRALGSSPRAVGRAAGANPLCLLVPCHRLVGSGGALTGFAAGLELKRTLLEREGVALSGAGVAELFRRPADDLP